jgi:hypothetical protein
MPPSWCCRSTWPGYTLELRHLQHTEHGGDLCKDDDGSLAQGVDMHGVPQLDVCSHQAQAEGAASSTILGFTS